MIKIYELLFTDKSEAEKVLEQAKEVLKTYGEVTLADICELASIEPMYSDTQKRLTNLDGAKIIENTEDNACSIVLPKFEDQG